eukprot:1814962-Amphidinium_carterae.1
MEATIEHLVWLLYPKLAHCTFTMTTFRILKVRFGGHGMTLRGLLVLLQFLWLVVTLFGPCLPVLITLSALLANTYSVLLFNTDPQLLEMNKSQEEGARLPNFGFSMVTLLAVVLQSSNLL